MWREWRSRQPLLFITAVAHAALFALCVILAMFDDTRITGVNRWIKPMKFAVSIAIYLASMAWYWPVAIASAQARQYAAPILAGTMIFETAIILAQAARGVRSHFNTDMPMDGLLFKTGANLDFSWGEFMSPNNASRRSSAPTLSRDPL